MLRPIASYIGKCPFVLCSTLIFLIFSAFVNIESLFDNAIVFQYVEKDAPDNSLTAKKASDDASINAEEGKNIVFQAILQFEVSLQHIPSLTH